MQIYEYTFDILQIYHWHFTNAFFTDYKLLKLSFKV
jgi:hypothetical protein